MDATSILEPGNWRRRSRVKARISIQNVFSEVRMDINTQYQSGALTPDPSIPVPGSDVINEDTDKPDRDIDTFSDDESPPPQDWKHPDDGKSLSDQDVEWPLKP